MTFRLERQSPGKTSTRFHVVDDNNAICGIITVPNEAVGDLENHWKSAPASSSPKKNAASARKQNPAVAAMVKASKERGPISRQAILRGCSVPMKDEGIAGMVRTGAWLDTVVGDRSPFHRAKRHHERRLRDGA